MLTIFRRAPCTFLFLLILFALRAPCASADTQRKNILILHSYSREYRWTEEIHEGVAQELDNFDDPHLVFTEYLDWKRFPDETSIAMQRDTFRYKYRNTKIDVIITSDDRALSFAVQNREELFSGAPIVFTGVYAEAVPGLTGDTKDITGVFEEQDIRTTVQIALRLQKKPRAAYIISDLNESGQAVEKHIRETLRELAPTIPVWSLSNGTVESIEAYVAGLKPNDLVFIGTYSIDRSGKSFSGETLIGRVCEVSNTPVYVLNTHQLGTGALGGHLLNSRLLGTNAGTLAVRILAGEDSNGIEPLSAASFTTMFDWNAVRRYGIKTRELPRNAIFLNREIPFLIKYRKEAISAAAVFLLLVLAFNVVLDLYRKTRRLAIDLTERNAEITQLNETLSQSEEELRQQFNEITIIKESLEASEERYRLAAIGSNDAIWDRIFPSGFVHYSARWYEMTGYDPKKNREQLLMDIVHPDDQEAFRSAMRAHADGTTDFVRVEVRIRIASGKYKWVLIRCKSVKNAQNETERIAGSITDIDDRKNKEAEIEKLAYYDQLTGLPNRILSIKKTQEAIETCDEDKQCGLIFIDIDNFKHINDTFGHSVGDKVLQQAAKSLSSMVNENISLSRFGGDEFTIFIENTTREQMEKFGTLAIRLLSRKAAIDGRYHFLTARAGIAMYPDNAGSFGELFQNAEAALHRAKSFGKNGILMFDDSIQKELVARMEMKNCLSMALDNDELGVAYQPQINLATHKISGFEALARWNSPRLGNVSPGEFIPVAEEAGMIDGIGFFVIADAAKFIKRAGSEGFKDFSVSVNVSVKQLQEESFTARIIKILDSLDVPPGRIALEITESFLIDDLDPVIARLNELREAGFKLSLDDFGKGYSSLSYLRTLPLDYIKIDKCFIDDIIAHGPTVPLARTIIELSHELGLKVVAEGVETKEQLDYLRTNGCDFVQGYYYSKPEREDVIMGKLELSFE